MSLLPSLLNCTKDYVYKDRSNTAVVDLTKQIGTVEMTYGANEDDNWMGFSKNSETHELHKTAGSKYIRVWISNPDWRESTIPLTEGIYDFTNLDNFVNAVLNSDAIPFILFAHAPQELSIRGKADNSNPPIDLDKFADYVAYTVTHLRESFEQSSIDKYHVNNWYIEIWNEPWQDIWWQDEIPLYVKLYNTVYESIKEIAPNAKVGGYSLEYHTNHNPYRLKQLITYCKLDFVSLHHYGNSIRENSTDAQKMKNVKKLFYDSIIDLNNLIEELSPGEQIQIINSEYNSDYRESYMSHLDEQFTAAWYASALIWQIKSQIITLEMFYSGTSPRDNRGFGMWSISEDNSLNPWPVYQMKEKFTQINKKGARLFATYSNSDFLDILAVENNDDVFITIVNKKKINCDARIRIIHNHFSHLIKVNNLEKYYITNEVAEFPLEPYEVAFLYLQ
jgi:hypothetical protein